MKKVYLLVSGLLLTAGAVNAQMTGLTQERAAVNFAPFLKTNVANRTGIVEDRAADDIIWEDNFDDAGVWTAAGPSGDFTISGWSIDNTTTGWYFGETDDMGTEGNFARFVNGDPTGLPAPIEDGPFTLTYNLGINLVGVPAPHLEFEQYGARFLTLQSVEVSTDGGVSWMEAGNNNDIAPLTIDGGDVYAQPETRRYNLGCALEGDLSSVRVRLLWDGAINGPDMNYVEYGWFVDNMRIVEGHEFDSDMQAAYFRSGVGISFESGLEYYAVPTSQLTAIDFAAETINKGGSTFANLFLDARVVKDASEVFAGTSDAADLAPCAADSVGTTTQFTPTTTGTYEVTWEFLGDGTDTYEENNVMTDEFEVTDYIYGRDNGVSTNAITNFASNGGQPFLIGNGFDIFADGVIGAIEVKINDAGTNVGELIYGQINIFSEADGDFIYLGQTADHMITSGENGGTITLMFDEALEVSAGDLILVMAGHYGGNDVGFGMAQETEQGVWGYDASSTRFGLADPNAIMVRADMRDFASIEEEAIKGFSVSQNMPNPFGDNAVINYELTEAANVSVQFVDISGKLVASINNGTQAAGTYKLDVDANEFAEGVYFYTFTVGTQTITKRMVVTK